jgi:hypothetical protein
VQFSGLFIRKSYHHRHKNNLPQPRKDHGQFSRGHSLRWTNKRSADSRHRPWTRQRTKIYCSIESPHPMVHLQKDIGPAITCLLAVSRRDLKGLSTQKVLNSFAEPILLARSLRMRT